MPTRWDARDDNRGGVGPGREASNARRDIGVGNDFPRVVKKPSLSSLERAPLASARTVGGSGITYAGGVAPTGLYGVGGRLPRAPALGYERFRPVGAGLSAWCWF